MLVFPIYPPILEVILSPITKNIIPQTKPIFIDLLFVKTPPTMGIVQTIVVTMGDIQF